MTPNHERSEKKSAQNVAVKIIGMSQVPSASLIEHVSEEIENYSNQVAEERVKEALGSIGDTCSKHTAQARAEGYANAEREADDVIEDLRARNFRLATEAVNARTEGRTQGFAAAKDKLAILSRDACISADCVETECLISRGIIETLTRMEDK